MRKQSYLSLLLLALSITLSGQAEDRVFYYGVNGTLLDGPENARVYRELIRRSDRKYILKTFRLADGQWEPAGRERIRIQGNGEQVIHVVSDKFFPDRIYRQMEETARGIWFFRESTTGATLRTGTLRTGTTSRYLPLHLEGTVIEYHPSGEIKSRSEYLDNRLISNQNWLADGSPYIDSIFYSADRDRNTRWEMTFSGAISCSN